MLEVVRSVNQEIIKLLEDDPVRPEIPAEQRLDGNGAIYVLKDDNTLEPRAVVCVKFLAEVPERVEELMSESFERNTAVFYTIWSYAQGAGRTLIEEARSAIQRSMPEVNTYVTLSPKTEMARRFHLKNGAEVYRENPDSVNYLYR